MSQQVVTIEKTAKRWKKAKLLAFGLLLFAFVLMIVGASASSPATSVAAVLAFIGAIGVGVYAAFGAWWHHG
jgi:small-conductance mechanosensitive channel